MEYQVWKKDEFGDTWTKTDCGDIAAAKREVLSAAKEAKEAVLTVAIPFTVQLKVGEPGAVGKKVQKDEEKDTGETTEEEPESETDKD